MDPQDAPAPTAKPPAPKKSLLGSLDEYYKQWEAKTRAMREETARVDWRGTDWSKLRAEDVGVRIGPPLTAEQFRAHRERARAAGAADPRVLHAPGPAEK